MPDRRRAGRGRLQRRRPQPAGALRRPGGHGTRIGRRALRRTQGPAGSSGAVARPRPGRRVHPGTEHRPDGGPRPRAGTARTASRGVRRAGGDRARLRRPRRHARADGDRGAEPAGRCRTAAGVPHPPAQWRAALAGAAVPRGGGPRRHPAARPGCGGRCHLSAAQRRRGLLVQRLSATLAGAATIREVSRLVVAALREPLGASRVAVGELEPERLIVTALDLRSPMPGPRCGVPSGGPIGPTWRSATCPPCRARCAAGT